jgi:predicted ATPase
VYDHESLLNMTAIQAAIDEVLDDEEADDEYTEPTFNFTDALKHLLEGGLVKREAWTEEFLYVNVEAGEQRICVSSDDVAHTHWEATSSDILATDWQLSNKS